MKKVKKCTKCGEWKELSGFYKRKGSKDGYNNICKECCKKIKKEYYISNKEIWAKKNKKYYENNKEKIIYNAKKNWENNKEKTKVLKKEYYKKYKEKIRTKQNTYNNSYVLLSSKYTEEIKLYEKIRQNNEFLEVKCTYCGNWFKPIISEITNRLQAINGTGVGEQRLYCSDNCKLECPTYGRVKYPKGYKKATSREVQPELRQMVLLRDNYTCQKCEKSQDELKTGLHCHHYEGIEINPIESADIDCCITLCKECHKEVHKLQGCNYSDMRRKKC